MQEPYIEGLATHDDPESYAGGARDQPKAAGEALTGACTGRTTSREITQFGAPTPSPDAIRQHGTERECEFGAGSARSKTPGVCRNSLRENREIH